MGGKDKRAEYLQKARDAEAEAEKAKDPAAKEAWKRVAVSYLELARLFPERDRS
jgi:hypothetical protein